MPKIKTNSGAKKRFSITRNGKVKRACAYARHILEHKSPKQKRRLRGTTIAADVEAPKVKRMLPYA